MERVDGNPNIQQPSPEKDGVKTGLDISNFLNNPELLPRTILLGSRNAQKLLQMNSVGNITLDSEATQYLEEQQAENYKTTVVPVMPALRTVEDFVGSDGHADILLKLTDANPGKEKTQSSYIYIDGASTYFEETGWVLTNATQHRDFNKFIDDPEGFFLFYPTAPHIMKLDDAKWYAGINNHITSFERSSLLRVNMDISQILINNPKLAAFYESVKGSSRRFFIDDGGIRLKNLISRHGKPFH